MPRKPSAETQVKTLRRIVNTLEAEVRSLKQQRDTYQANLVAMKTDRDEWKARFDKLLVRTPAEPKSND